MLFYSRRGIHSGCWLLGVALTAKTVVRHVCDTLCNIPYARLDQYAQTLSSLLLLLFVLVSEALQAPACQKSENRLLRG